MVQLFFQDNRFLENDPYIVKDEIVKMEIMVKILILRHFFFISGRWAKICRKLPGRTDNMCLIRAGRLLEWSIKYHRQKVS